MKFLFTLILFGFFISVFSPTSYALDARGHLSYSARMYENDLEISSSYKLKPNESFLVACNKPGDERYPMFSKITREELTVFPALLWNTKFICHISVIDTKKRGRIISSSGSFRINTPPYYLP